MRGFDDEDPVLDDDLDLDDLDMDLDFDLDLDTDFDKDFDIDDLPELDLSELDFTDDIADTGKTKRSGKNALTKYEQEDEGFDFDGLDDMIKSEAIRALDMEEGGPMLPSKYVLDEDADNAEYFDYEEEDFEEFEEKPKKKRFLAIKIIIGIIIFLLLAGAFLAFTKPGRSLAYRIAALWVHEQVNQGLDEQDTSDKSIDNPEDPENIQSPDNPDIQVPVIPDEIIDEPEIITDPEVKLYRSEDYVRTYLLFGVESIYVDSNGTIKFDTSSVGNTDAILLLSVNTKDNTLKLTSLLRDTYVEVPGYKTASDGTVYGNKINSVYATGYKTGETTEEKKANGANLLVKTIEETYDIDITGYAFVNFSSFEKIVDRLGGVDIQLGASEAKYLRNTNYISKPQYRTVQEGWNHMNGNQVLGYCRVRKVVTLGGANNDYGRTQRHRRVINAIVSQYKSLSLTSMYSVLKDILGYINTNLTVDQLTELIENIVENKIFTIEQMRLPADDLFVDMGKKGIWNGYNKITYAISLDGYRDANIKKLHEFVFLDEPEEGTESGN